MLAAPASVSFLSSISPPLPRHLSPESVTAFSFICIYFPLPSPASPSPPFGFISPFLLPCVPALPNHGHDSSRTQQTLPQVLVYLTYSNVSSLYYTGCGKNDTAGLARIARRHYVYTLLLEKDISTRPETQQVLIPEQQNTCLLLPSKKAQ